MEKISFFGQKMILKIMLFFLSFVLMIGCALFSYLFYSFNNLVLAIVFVVLTLGAGLLTGVLFVRLWKTILTKTNSQP